ncbi:hypothetical protein B0H66DRAFT_595292 [Apodospora peruviana]|uniref:Uncharacterized protein n=1 Tax=Apodospora peruviana TaxID=516989 RepID=A0AAE0HTT6_9PEZI|nr:hypothetical protein B0H66DRAFT_595292 [Apodospora peruviana]
MFRDPGTNDEYRPDDWDSEAEGATEDRRFVWSSRRRCCFDEPSAGPGKIPICFRCVGHDMLTFYRYSIEFFVNQQKPLMYRFRQCDKALRPLFDDDGTHNHGDAYPQFLWEDGDDVVFAADNYFQLQFGARWAFEHKNPSGCNSPRFLRDRQHHPNNKKPGQEDKGAVWFDGLGGAYVEVCEPEDGSTWNLNVPYNREGVFDFVRYLTMQSQTQYEETQKWVSHAGYYQAPRPLIEQVSPKTNEEMRKAVIPPAKIRVLAYVKPGTWDQKTKRVL